MKTNDSSLFVQRMARCGAKAYQKYKTPFLATLIFGLLAYGYAFTNKLPNLDDVYYLFGKGSETASGRWGLELLSYVFPDMSMPWIYGIITLFFMAVSVCVIVRIFEIRSRILQVLLAGTVIVFPSMICQVAFMFTSAPYGVCFLLAVTAVYLLRKGTLKDGLLAALCTVLSLSIYQAYLAIIASLLVIALIQDLLADASAAKVFKRGVFYVVTLLVSLGVYYGVLQLAIRIQGAPLCDYATDAMAFELSSVPFGILDAYTTFVQYFTWLSRGLIPTAFSQKLHLLLVLVGGILVILRLFAKGIKKPAQLILLAAMFALLPLCINCMFIVISASAMHTLVLYGFAAIYVLVAVLADPFMTEPLPAKLPERLRRVCLNGAVIVLALILAVNVYVANASSLKMHLRYESTYAFYTSLAADLQTVPGVNEQTKLAIVGAYQEPDYDEEEFLFLDGMLGASGISPTVYSREEFFGYYLGIDMPFADEDEIKQLQQTAEYAEMPVYPYYGSIQMIGDYLVVKLS